MRPEAAAYAIGVTLEDLKKLVADGLLKPYKYQKNSRADATKKELLFSKCSIESYLSRREDAQGLISTEVAARLLGYRRTQGFLWNDVRRGRIKPVKKIKGKRRVSFFFNRMEVNALVSKRAHQKAICKDKAYVDTKVAAEILGVNVSAVHKMVIAGIVHVEKGQLYNGHLINLYRRSHIEQLRQERDAYKADCAGHGKSTRFGRPLRAA